MKKLLVALFAFSALYMSSCNSSSGGDPKSVLTSFFDAMAKKDIDGARKLATADSKTMFDLMEMGMKMRDTMNDVTKEKFNKAKMEIGEAKIDGDKATVNVKELESGESINFVLKKESGAWKVAMDMNTMMSIGVEKMKEKGMSDGDLKDMDAELEKFKNMSADSVRMMMDKGFEALDSVKKLMNKK